MLYTYIFNEISNFNNPPTRTFGCGWVGFRGDYQSGGRGIYSPNASSISLIARGLLSAIYIFYIIYERLYNEDLPSAHYRVLIRIAEFVAAAGRVFKKKK